MFVDYEFQPRYEDFYKNGTMRLPSVLRLFETTSCKHSDIVKDNILADTENGKAWVFTDWYLKINFLPKIGQKVTCKTWTQPIKQILFSIRDYEIYADGELAVSCISRWIILDLKTNRPQRFDSSFETQYKTEDKCVFGEAKLPHLESPEAFTREVPITIRRSDIDYNDHVHNLIYIDYALEALPEEVYNANDYSSLRICYKQAVKPGEQIVCKYAFVEGKHVCCIFNSEGELKTQIELGTITKASA